MSKRAPLRFNVDRVTPTPAAQPDLSPNVQTRKRENREAKAGREGRQFIAAHVTPEAAKQFKLLVVQRDTTTQDLLIEAINDLFAKYGLSRIA